jgi:putative transposase
LQVNLDELGHLDGWVRRTLTVQIAVDTSIPALYVTRVLDQGKAERGLPKVIRTDNGPEFAGRTMQTWAARNGVELRFIQPGKPVQNAYIE